jgi:hypothetical protein
MKAITRREMFKELLSKDTIKQVAGAWYGFTQPLQEGLDKQMKPESLMDKVNKKEAQLAKKINNEDRKEG